MTYDTQANRPPDPGTARSPGTGAGTPRFAARRVGLRPLHLLVLLASMGAGCAGLDKGDGRRADMQPPLPQVMAPDATPVASAAAGVAQPAACAPAALAAMRQRTPVAVQDQRKLALISGTVYTWRGAEQPRAIWHGAVQVALGPTQAYVLDDRRRVIAWQDGVQLPEMLLDETVWIAAGAGGLLAIRCDGSLWERSLSASDWTRSADAAVHAARGDATFYYVDAAGGLFARGQAWRGQFGDGQLAAQEEWTRVADDVVAVVAHAAHALYQRADGTVMGTGGNRHGALGAHGFGDKAASWGFMLAGARRIATGSRHSMVIRTDGSLWVWGQRAGFLPSRVLDQVVACSVDAGESLAMTADGALWQWSLGHVPVRLDLPPAR